MRTMTSALVATTLFAAVSAAAIMSPALAASHYDKQDRYIQNFCDRNPHANDCNDWKSNRGGWNNDKYQNFYRNHHTDSVFSPPDVASIFGVTINLGGAAPGPVVVNNAPNHLQACRAHFHTYDAHSDSYMGYDHQRHRCMY